MRQQRIGRNNFKTEEPEKNKLRILSAWKICASNGEL